MPGKSSWKSLLSKLSYLQNTCVNLFYPQLSNNPIQAYHMSRPSNLRQSCWQRTMCGQKKIKQPNACALKGFKKMHHFFPEKMTSVHS
mmetsp:Transcript_34750/g.40227  ORF Transcript_34750/g.40227 Transcript_34750/m.40227 type:complete len:88 (+) Transcript_34750:232-495(+)